MKKILFIAFIAACFGCSKQSNPTPPKPTNWIMGKWKRTFYGDTTFYRDGSKTFTQQHDPQELNFVDTNKVIVLSSPYDVHYYSLSTMTATFDNGGIVNGAVKKITKISDTEIHLYFIDYGTDVNIKGIGWFEIYQKE